MDGFLVGAKLGDIDGFDVGIDVDVGNDDVGAMDGHSE